MTDAAVALVCFALIAGPALPFLRLAWQVRRIRRALAAMTPTKGTER